MRATLSLGYVLGASIQLERMSLTIGDGNPKQGVDVSIYVLMCLHEASNMLEDLDVIRWYLDPNNSENNLSKVINQMRNHIRHDNRDNVNSSCGDGRRQDLGIKTGLAFDFTLIEEGFCMGKACLDKSQISKYIKWAEDKISKSFLDFEILKMHYKSDFSKY